MMLIRLTFILFAVVVASSAASAQDRCKDILANGVWEYQVGMSDTHMVQAFLNWYGSSSSSSSNSSKKQLFSGGGTYAGISGELGLSNDEQQNQQFFSHLEKLDSAYEQYDSTVISFVRRASDVIVKAWTDCMGGGTGVRASLAFTGDPHDLLVELKFGPIRPDDLPAKVQIGAPNGVSCAISNHDNTVSVTLVGSTIRCSRKIGSAGAIVLNSDTVVFPDKTLQFDQTVLRTDLTGKRYATCDVIEEVRNGRDTYGPPERLPDSGDGFGGGTPAPHNPIALQVSDEYILTNVAAHCKPLGPPTSCNFVRGGDTSNIQWTVPNRRAELHPTTDGPPVFEWLTGTQQKVILGVDHNKNPIQQIATYGKGFSVEFPSSAVDVKLYCKADGGERIFSLSDIQKQGDQIYLKDVRVSATGRIIDLGVVRFDLSE